MYLPITVPSGDLILELNVASHPYFTRRGRHLELKLPVTLGEAAFGAKVDVPTPGGTIELTVPAGSGDGTRLRIKGQGVRDSKGDAGDLFAVVQIKLPKHMDAQSQELLEKFEARHPLDPRESLVW